MRKVFKYELPMDDYISVVLPKGADILHFDSQHQNQYFQIWALVDPDAPKEVRKFRIAGTGHPIEDDLKLRHIATAITLQGQLVFHLFEVQK